jgi:hypothetical protein
MEQHFCGRLDLGLERIFSTNGRPIRCARPLISTNGRLVRCAKQVAASGAARLFVQQAALGCAGGAGSRSWCR